MVVVLAKSLKGIYKAAESTQKRLKWVGIVLAFAVVTTCSSTK